MEGGVLLNGRPWTPDDTATLKRMSVAGFNDIQIAQATGHSVKTIRRRRHDMQIPSYIDVRYGNWGDLTADARRAISAAAGFAA